MGFMFSLTLVFGPSHKSAFVVVPYYGPNNNKIIVERVYNVTKNLQKVR